MNQQHLAIGLTVALIISGIALYTYQPVRTVDDDEGGGGEAAYYPVTRAHPTKPYHQSFTCSQTNNSISTSIALTHPFHPNNLSVPNGLQITFWSTEGTIFEIKTDIKNTTTPYHPDTINAYNSNITTNDITTTIHNYPKKKGDSINTTIKATSPYLPNTTLIAVGIRYTGIPEKANQENYNMRFISTQSEDPTWDCP